MSGNNLQRQPNKKGGGKPDPDPNYSVQQEAINYDKQVYKGLLEEVDFKEADKTNNPKHVSILQEFPSLLRKNEFVSFFSQVLFISNPPSSPRDIFEGLTRTFKLAFEFQFKLLLSFFRSNKEKFVKEAQELFKGKCEEVFYSKLDVYLSNDTINNIVQLIKNTENFKNDNFFKTNFIQFLMMINSKNTEVTEKLFDNLNLQIDVKDLLNF
jgi:hypothetical protein